MREPRLSHPTARVLLGCALGLVASPASTAGAATGAGPVELSAPPGCIDVATFQQDLAALPASSAPKEAPRSIRIVITQRDRLYTAELQLVLADGTRIVRRVASERCSDVTDALEFVTALALGLDRPPPAPPAPVAPEPVAPPAPPASGSQVDASPGMEGGRWRLVARVWGAVVGGVGPDPEIAPGISIGVVRDVPGWIAPEVDLGGTWATSGGLATSSGEATLTLADASVDVCPVRLALTRALAIRPCAELDVGALIGAASGPHVASAPPETQPWVAIGATGRVEWRLGRAFSLQAAGGAAVPVVHDRFFFLPGSTVYDASAVGGVFRLGASVQWP